MNWLKGLARAFTIPAKERKALDSSPLVKIGVQIALPKILEGAATVVDAQFPDPAQNAMVKALLAAGLNHAFDAELLK